MTDEHSSRNLAAAGPSSGRILALASTLFYFLVVVGLTGVAALRPNNYWDLLAYAGVIESWRTSDAATIHREVFLSIRNLREYAALVGTEPVSDFNRDVAEDSIHFVQQLPFYSIKPLYCMAAATVHRLGFSYPRSIALVSAASFFGLAVLTWVWFRRYLAEWWCAVFATFLIVTPPILAAGRMATPDALELFLIVLGVYLILEFSRAAAGGLILLLAIWVRPDALIIVGVLLCTFFFLRKTDFAEWCTFCLLALFSYGVIRLFAGPYSWPILFHNSFFAPLTTPGNAVIVVTPRMYFLTLAQNGWTLLKSTSLPLVGLMGVLAIVLHHHRAYRLITGAILVSAIVHFLLYPSAEHRFYVLPTYFAPFSLILACSAWIPK